MVDPDLMIGNVTCAIHRSRFRGSHYQIDEEKPSRRWMLELTQIPETFVSGRDFGSAPTGGAPVRADAQSRFFRCTSGAAGLMCVSRPSGHGFFLSYTRQRIF
jgi:hypothetical protein